MKMLQLALLIFPKGTLFNRASAFPVVRRRRTAGRFNTLDDYPTNVKVLQIHRFHIPLNLAH
jgi:hypothetical protein